MNNIKMLVTVLIFLMTSSLIFAEGNNYLTIAEKMPTVKGGIKEVYQNVEYPKIAQQAGVEGKVYLLIYINEKGKVDKAEVVKGIGAGCNEAAVSAIKKCEFNPGILKGKPVKVKMAIPVQFKLG